MEINEQLIVSKVINELSSKHEHSIGFYLLNLKENIDSIKSKKKKDKCLAIYNESLKLIEKTLGELHENLLKEKV